MDGVVLYLEETMKENDAERPMGIAHEMQASKKALWKARERLASINELYPKQFYFPEWVQGEVKSDLARPSFETLHRLYWELVQEKERKSLEHLRTDKERSFVESLRTFNAKTILHSVWIGNHCMDIFVPNVRSPLGDGRRMRGLVFEIDGDVHFYEDKMRKDEIKSDLLKMIGIGEAAIPNWQFGEKTIKALQASLNGFRPLDSRERRRLWRRIYLLTIAIQMNDKRFYEVFTNGGEK